jgi:hypothetical protein
LALVQYSIFSYFEYFLHKIYLNALALHVCAVPRDSASQISDLLKLFLTSTIFYFLQLIFH